MSGSALGKLRGITVGQGHSKHWPQPPRTHRCHARPTIGVFVAVLAVLQRDGGTSLPIWGAFTAVELSHRWGPWQVFNDLDFNWMGGWGGCGKERERDRKKGLRKNHQQHQRPTEKESSCGGKDLRTKFLGALQQLGHLIPSIAPSKDRPEVGHIPNGETLLLHQVFQPTLFRVWGSLQSPYSTYLSGGLGQAFHCHLSYLYCPRCLPATHRVHIPLPGSSGLQPCASTSCPSGRVPWTPKGGMGQQRYFGITGEKKHPTRHSRTCSGFRKNQTAGPSLAQGTAT